MKCIRVFSPATVANVSCGFDVLGLALDSTGDVLEVRLTDEPGIRITEITGQDLPLDPDRNVCGVAVKQMLTELESEAGIEIALHKGIKPGSGIGSSAASSAGAVWAVNELLGRPFEVSALIPFAMEGERLASEVAHADNVAPALLGGFALVRSYEPLDVISLPCPPELHAVVLHPQIELKTSDSRKILKSKITLQQGIRQWGNLAGLVAGLYENDYALIGRSLQDHIVEPVRSVLIPKYDLVKQAAREAGALGSGISGSGPSIFALCEGSEKAEAVAKAMKSIYEQTSIPFDLHKSGVSRQGVRILPDE